MRVSLNWLKELIDIGDIALPGLFSRIGMEVEDILHIGDDTILDVEVPPIRPDLLGMWGIARDVGMFIGRKVKFPEVKPYQRIPQDVTVKIEDSQICQRYSCGVLREIKKRQTPEWLRKRLISVGCPCHNTVVDVGNYVMYETGQPIHIFDIDKLSGNISIRLSRGKEFIETLDGELKEISDDVLLICDNDMPVAIAGIIGGKLTGVTEMTRNLLVESAYFNPITIRKGGKRLGISTDASYRFERGGDLDMVDLALQRVMFLVEEYYGAKPEGIIDEYPLKRKKRTIYLKPEYVNRVLGSALSKEEITSFIERLGFKLKKDKIEIPSYRRDITKEVDLIEELARLEGYDNLPPKIPVPYIVEERQYRKEKIRNAMVTLGFSEVYTLPLVRNGSVNLVNWMREDMSALREGMMEGLLSVLVHNKSYGNSDIRIFEMGKVFSWDNGVSENRRLASIMTGKRENPLLWASEDVNFFDMKGVMEAFLKIVGISKWELALLSSPVYGSASAEIKYKGTTLGHIGDINPHILKRLDIDFPVYGMEIEIDKIELKDAKKYTNISRFPPVVRDISILIDRRLSVGSVMEFIRKKSSPMLENIEVFDYYSGKGISKNKVAIGLRFWFKAKDTTLKKSDVEPVMGSIVDKLSREYNAVLRDKLWTS